MPVRGLSQKGALVGALLACVLLAAGCQARLETGVTVAENGSGRLEVGLGVDDDLAGRLPGAVESVRVDDLTARGWLVTAPTREADGRQWVRAGHDFADPAELSQLVDEVDGDGGPLQEATLVITRDPEFTRWELTLSAAWDGSLATFADEPFLGAMGGSLPVTTEAPDPAAITLAATVRVPGMVTSDGGTVQADGSVRWEPVLGTSPVTLRVTGETRNDDVIDARSTVRRGVRALVIWGGVVVLLGLGWVIWRVRRRRRARHATA